ncbi:hypothetical protein GGTG_04955 [Gaeumannomyces tritici R3-111a-1]|uniref:Uncharacterized protein n=1 Tax=Gaeumannomyces tritici (strain R3-111a-1) TaxID=644352 RepID=J3NUJ9_GAET3|nr:hypothetical protein GGTG_04955 [Gaeumannomyces tritici R3-111a-1]EJT79872.1 hypothetical protein GGTG_04955 [Gaeumannomyces tritici R3-111a-1]
MHDSRPSFPLDPEPPHRGSGSRRCRNTQTFSGDSRHLGQIYQTLPWLDSDPKPPDPCERDGTVWLARQRLAGGAAGNPAVAHRYNVVSMCAESARCGRHLVLGILPARHVCGCEPKRNRVVERAAYNALVKCPSAVLFHWESELEPAGGGKVRHAKGTPAYTREPAPRDVTAGLLAASWVWSAPESQGPRAPPAYLVVLDPDQAQSPCSRHFHALAARAPTLRLGRSPRCSGPSSQRKCERRPPRGSHGQRLRFVLAIVEEDGPGGEKDKKKKEKWLLPTTAIPNSGQTWFG